MVKSTGGPGSSQLQESARYKTVYPNFPETKSRVSPLSKVWFSWGTRVLLWHKQAPLGVCNVMVRGISCEHHMAAGLPVHVQYTHPVAADAGCHPGKSKDGPWRATEFNQTNSTIPAYDIYMCTLRVPSGPGTPPRAPEPLCQQKMITLACE